MEKQKVKYPIGFKLILIVAVLVLMVLGLSTALVVFMVSRDSETKAKDTNLTLNEVTSQTVESWMVTMQKNAIGFFNNTLLSRNKDAQAEMFDDFCFRNPDVWFVQAPGIGVKTSPQADIFLPGSGKVISAWLSENKTSAEKAKDSIQILEFTSVMGQPSVCLMFPYEMNGKTESASVAFNVTKAVDLMTNSRQNTTFIMDHDGNILISSSTDNSEGEGYLQAAKRVVRNAVMDAAQSLETDDNGKGWYVAYKKIAGEMYSVTCISENKIFQAVHQTAYRIVLISMAILFLAILLIRHFSKTLTRPIHALVGAAGQIEKGDFNVELKAKTQDEIGLLTNRFVSMSKGLAERERLKDNFSRFTNSAIAEKAMKGELVLGGENRNATIFFSDIRSFTAMSEKLTPAEVVEFLNEYMTKMVSCVLKTHGTVDKYIGDAIMAVWGAPESAGSPEADAWNAVVGALMMRSELYKLNQKRKEQGKPEIKIGCGINSGKVVAGQIGSDARMEYTVIGDAVNLASRTEALNKPFQTDILITENTYNLIGDRLVVEEMPSVHVKGKEAAIRMFAVINIKGVGGVQTMSQVRKLLGFHEIDKSQVNTDEEEKKYKIGK